MASAIPLCLGFLTIFLHCVAAQQNNGSVSVGASLTAAPDARAWLSRSGEFALGFQQLQGSDSFLLSIWYDKIPDKTIIWYLKDGPMVPRGSKAELIDRRGLILTDPQGRVVWASASISDLAYGLMNDTGNFVLIGIDSTTRWESFGYPADTMLPTQILVKGGEINSKMSKANFAPGKFQLRLLQGGNLVLNTVDRFSRKAYYDSETNDYSNSTNSGEQVIFDETGYLYILRRNGQRFDLTPRYAVPSGDYYHRASLDSDGVFTQYYYPKDSTNNSRWIVIWLVPENICKTGQACGLNNVCSLDGNRPKCECPQGFYLSDPSYSNGDCEPEFAPNCEAGFREEKFDFTELDNIDWPGSDYGTMNPSNEENCKTSCLKDCFCAVAIYRDNQCWWKKLPLSNGQKDPSKDVKAFLKFRKDDHTPGNSPVLPRENRNAKANRRVRIIVIPVVVGVTVLLGICLFVYRRMKQKGLSSVVLDKNTGKENEGEDLELPLFDFNTLANATNNFSHSCKLGEGGYGPVYKGMLDDGKEIAVKRHSRQSKQGLDEFKNEVQCIAKLQHRNLVKLLGCCIEEGERMLIYEYMPNLSLNNFIFDEDKGERKSLDWSNRYSIIIGIARGLLYLHQDSRLRIIHRDLKASNILLDKDMNPKISDFGLARSMEENITKGNTRRVMGTYGYMAPEYTIDGIYSIKSDVFSFGVLVLEIVSGKKNRGFHHADHDLNLLGHAWRLYQEGKQLELIDGTINGSYVQSHVNRAIHIGLLCVQKYPEVRPDMPMVVLMLASEIPLSEPVQPGFFTERRLQEGKSPSANHERSSYNHHMTANFSKLDKFEGMDFRRWQKKMHFFLTSINRVYVLSTPCPEDGGDNATVEQMRKWSKWENHDYIARGLILNG